MPITCYTGLPRSGKTYQVVSHVIVAALRQGRRVVTNIAGLQEHKIREHLISEGLPENQIGEIVCVDHDEVLQEHFFRTDSDAALGVDAFVQPGDLVALDEVWRFWPKRGKIPDRHQNFFRMHGHFVHERTGLICEVALISQTVRDVNENIRDVVQETYHMTKNTAVGSDKTFHVDVYARGSEMKRDLLRSFPGVYDPIFFDFYKSHSQAQAGSLPREESVDKRSNILKGPLFKIVIPVMLVVGVIGAWQIFGYFGKSKPVPQSAVENTPVNGPAAPVAQSASSNVGPWRVVGLVARSANGYVLLEKEGAYRRDFDLSKYSGREFEFEGVVDGAKAAKWTGSTAPKTALGGLLK